MLSETPQILNRNLPFGQRQNMAGLIKNYSRTSANGQRPRAWQWLGFTPLWITLRRETFSSDVNSREFFRSLAKKSLRAEVSLLHGFLRLRSRSRRRARKKGKIEKIPQTESHNYVWEVSARKVVFFGLYLFQVCDLLSGQCRQTQWNLYAWSSWIYHLNLESMNISSFQSCNQMIPWGVM